MKNMVAKYGENTLITPVYEVHSRVAALTLQAKDDAKAMDLSRDEVISHCLKGVSDYFKDIDIWPMEFIMPCGEKALFRDLSEFPTETLMCPCGDENHVIVDMYF